MAKCWEGRGCDEEMMSRCPHTSPDEKCPTKCAFAQCGRPSHEATSDAALVFDPWVDRSVALKEECTYCAFFLKNGPRIAHTE
jgi:hypothetical protein